MTEIFPKLREYQVALSRADINTGIVLDDQYNYALNPHQKVYTIFDNKIEALSFAKSIIIERKNIECYIHDENEKLLYFLDIERLNKY